MLDSKREELALQPDRLNNTTGPDLLVIATIVAKLDMSPEIAGLPGAVITVEILIMRAKTAKKATDATTARISVT